LTADVGDEEVKTEISFDGQDMKEGPAQAIAYGCTSTSMDAPAGRPVHTCCALLQTNSSSRPLREVLGSKLQMARWRPGVSLGATFAYVDERAGGADHA
jgi:hypothetical protein